MPTERGARLGLSDLLRADDDKRKGQIWKARLQVLTMIQSFRDRPDDSMTFEVNYIERGLRTDEAVVFNLTPEDFQTIPPAFQHVLTDMGITADDEVGLEFFHWGNDFAVKVLPKEVRDDKYGIELTTRGGAGSLIIPNPEPKGDPIEFPFNKRIVDVESRREVAKRIRERMEKGRAVSLWEAYSKMYGPRQNPFRQTKDVEHPLIVDAIEGAAMWTPFLLENRRKPEFQTA